MISIVITSFKEPKTIGKAIEQCASRTINEDYELYVVAPDKETLAVAKTYQKKNKHIKLFVDPGKGKSYALNLLMPKLKGKIVILTDGDVFISDNAVNHILKLFKDKKIGCVTGRPISQNDKNTMFGYWSHLLCDAGAHQARLNRWKNQSFLECSGYLWAFRNKVIKKFPLDVAEDTIVPYLFAQKGYIIGYAEDAKVFVKYPETLSDFIKQKNRTTKSHETITKYVDVSQVPRMKSFKNEFFEGFRAFLYPNNLKEFIWTLCLISVKMYIWILVLFHTKVKKDTYKDNWERVESTK